jgi:peptide/nickel transport system permease protein
MSKKSPLRYGLALLVADKSALLSALFLAAICVLVFAVGSVYEARGEVVDLMARMRPAFTLDHGWSGLLGTDPLGRSTVERLLVAGKASLSIAISAAVLAALIGTTLGIVGGYLGGWVDIILMRTADVVMSFPLLLLAVLFTYLLGPSVSVIVGLLAIGRAPLYLRVARAETLEIRTRLFVDAARCLGASPMWIMTREIAPLIVPTTLTLIALDIGQLMLIESALSFLGIGIQPPAVSWGGMVADGRRYLNTAWWLSAAPGLMILLVAIASTQISNWVRLASDPASRWRLEGGLVSRPRLVTP